MFFIENPPNYESQHVIKLSNCARYVLHDRVAEQNCAPSIPQRAQPFHLPPVEILTLECMYTVYIHIYVYIQALLNLTYTHTNIINELERCEYCQNLPLTRYLMFTHLNRQKKNPLQDQELRSLISEAPIQVPFQHIKLNLNCRCLKMVQENCV